MHTSEQASRVEHYAASRCTTGATGLCCSRWCAHQPAGVHECVCVCVYVCVYIYIMFSICLCVCLCACVCKMKLWRQCYVGLSHKTPKRALHSIKRALCANKRGLHSFKRALYSFERAPYSFIVSL